MKKTIIYGGAFNPPTVAHETILKACADYAQKINADLWVMPSGDRVDKKISKNRDLRIRYVNAMIQDIGFENKVIDVMTTEIDRSEPIETFNTVNELVDNYPDRSFFWVFGSDSIENMPSWENGQWLLDNLNIIAVRRSGIPIKTPVKNVIILEIETPNVSSTEVRRRIVSGESIDGMVGEKVKRLLNLEKFSL
jgi:nicotinate-nucleotide adenylyltransferase